MSYAAGINRRTFLGAMSAGLLAAPPALEAQPGGKVWRIGLIYSSLPPAPLGQGPFYDRMRELGWVYERDFVAEQRAFGERYELVPDIAKELIRWGVDVFVVTGGGEAFRMQPVTTTIPIVTSMAGDLVVTGVAASLARPGGNVTGVQTLMPELVGKHLSLLKEVIPHLSRSGVLFQSPDAPQLGSFDAVISREADTAAKSLGIKLQHVTVRDADEFEQAFSTFHRERAQAIVIPRNAFMGTHTKTLTTLGLKHRLPTISDIPGLAAQGGLMSYGYNLDDAVRLSADFVDKIMRGAKVGETPIQQPTRFRLVINLKTAKAIGLTIPQSLLLRADQVIQ